MAIPVRFRFELCKPKTLSDEYVLAVRNLKLGNLLSAPMCRLSQLSELMIEASPEILVEPLDIPSDDPYIFSTALCYGPWDWTNWGNDHEYSDEKKSIFEYLPIKVIDDLRNSKALLLLDQSVEGHGTSWMWDWFHKKCVQYDIQPDCVMFATGDQTAPKAYKEWCHSVNYLGKNIVVIPSTSLFYYVKRHTVKHNISTTFDMMLDHKRSNPPKYLFDCFMLRPRDSRILNYLHLLNAGLLNFGNIGMQNVVGTESLANFFHRDNLVRYKLPVDILDKIAGTSTERHIDHSNNKDNLQYSDYAERILTTMYETSWITQVVETTFFENETLFISEKSIKPIAYMQPFVTVGKKWTLRYLRNLGFKTFHPIIDESYDDEDDDGERLIKVVKELQRINETSDKLAWLESLRPIIEHNYNLFKNMSFVNSIEYNAINKHYCNYFKESNVS